jgi:hypothetical protein
LIFTRRKALKQVQKTEQKKTHWWEGARAQSLVTRARSGELSGLKDLSLFLMTKTPKYELEDGTEFVIADWLEPHLQSFFENNKSQDGLHMLQQTTAFFGCQDLLLDVQFALASGNSEGAGLRDVVVHEDREMIDLIMGTWDQDDLQARDHEKLIKDEGERNVLTAGWLNMETEDRVDWIKSRGEGEESSNE